MGPTFPRNPVVSLFLFITGVFFLGLFGWLITASPYFSRAATGSLILRIKAQGSHRDASTVGATLSIYNGPRKAYDDQKATFTSSNNAYSSTVSLPSGFNYKDRYALFIKPEKHIGRVFCNSELSGKPCTVPAFAFLTAINALDLTGQVFLGGDIPPGNGKVDAQDMSLIMKNLGKTDTADTDINGDGITDVVDYSLALYSLSQNAADDVIQLGPAPTATPSPTLAATPTASPSATPAASPTPTTAPTPTTKPTATPTLSATPTPSPTPLPQLGKNCTNGTAKVTKSINNAWDLNVLPIPYGKSQYMCVPVDGIVLHWSDSPNFSGNTATWGTLNKNNVVCGLAIDDKQTLQMSNFYDDKVTWEGCSSMENSVNIEINGTQFDLWYDGSCNIVNPGSNPALTAGQLAAAKQKVATQYGVSTTVLDWENSRYVDIMKAQEKRVLDAVRYLMLYYKVGKDKITGHFKLTTSKEDPGARFLDCIIKKI